MTEPMWAASCDADVVVDVTVCRTEQLGTSELRAVRELLDAAFEEAFTDDDWDHTLGGVHVLVRDAGVTVAHAAVVSRAFMAGGEPLPVGYVEGVATVPEWRRRGHAARAMERIARTIHDKYDLGALSANVPDFYAQLGWESWRGPTYVQAPCGRLRTDEDDDGVMVLRTPRTFDLDLTADLTCDWRAGDVW